MREHCAGLDSFLCIDPGERSPAGRVAVDVFICDGEVTKKTHLLSLSFSRLPPFAHHQHNVNALLLHK